MDQLLKQDTMWNKEGAAHFGVFFGWVFTSMNPAIIPQGLSVICSIMAIVNYYYTIREKRKGKNDAK